jgi:hypothetical protein
VRQNGTPPEVAADPDAWELTIEGEVNSPLTLTLGPDDVLRPDNTWTAKDTLMITARLSASGQALAGSGDWQGQEIWTEQRQGPLNIKLHAVLP